MIRHYALNLLMLLVFVLGCKQVSEKKITVSVMKKDKLHLALQPLQAGNKKYVYLIREKIESFYGFKVTILKGKTIPGKFNEKKSFNAKKIALYLDQSREEEFDFVLGVTGKKLALQKGLHGFGNKKSSVISLYDLKKKKNKLVSICLFQLGKSIGLNNCKKKNCLMNINAENVNLKTEKKAFCKTCFKNLNRLKKEKCRI